MGKNCYIVGFPIISKLIRGHTVELETVCFIPDDQLLNESKNEYGCVKFVAPQTSEDEVSPNSAEVKPVSGSLPEYREHNNERAESATKSCEGCRNWKRDKRWGMACTDCIRNVDRVVDNFNVAQSPVS